MLFRHIAGAEEQRTQLAQKPCNWCANRSLAVLAVDHGARRFEYRIIGPFRLEHHLGRITVVPDPCGSLVTYEQELEPKALTYVLDGAVADALNGLRDLVVGGRKSRSWVEPTSAPGRGGST